MGVLPHCGPPPGLEEGEWWTLAVGVASVLVRKQCAVGGCVQCSPPSVENSSLTSVDAALWLYKCVACAVVVEVCNASAVGHFVVLCSG